MKVISIAIGSIDHSSYIRRLQLCLYFCSFLESSKILDTWKLCIILDTVKTKKDNSEIQKYGKLLTDTYKANVKYIHFDRTYMYAIERYNVFEHFSDLKIERFVALDSHYILNDDIANELKDNLNEWHLQKFAKFERALPRPYLGGFFGSQIDLKTYIQDFYLMKYFDDLLTLKVKEALSKDQRYVGYGFDEIFLLYLLEYRFLEEPKFQFSVRYFNTHGGSDGFLGIRRFNKFKKEVLAQLKEMHGGHVNHKRKMFYNSS